MSVSVDLRSLQGSSGAERAAALGNLEKQLLCPICLDTFTKPVVILPCQHNLCRRCANELYQPSLFQVRSGRFRCPTCRQEVVLDRHGVYGLQRNLLVENIIDVYKQELSSPSVISPAPVAGPVGEVKCVDHKGEKLNIYCLTCQQPTCSLCKVFGVHRLCRVAPLVDIHQQKKAELEQELSVLKAKNDQVQAFINELELTWRRVEDNCQNQKQKVCKQFDAILSMLEERQKVMTQRISADEEERTGHAQSLTRRYGDTIEANSALLESASLSMEETDMAAFVQTSEELTSKLRAATSSNPQKTFEPTGENITHFRFDFRSQDRVLRGLDFIRAGKEVPMEFQPEQEHFPEDLQPEQETCHEETQPEEGHYPEGCEAEEANPDLQTSAAILEHKHKRQSINRVQKPQREEGAQNTETVWRMEPILAFIPPLAPTHSVLATTDLVSQVLGAVVPSLESSELVPEQQMENLALNDQTVLKETGEERAQEEEETQEESKQVEGFRTLHSIKEIQCEDQDGMNTQQAVILLFYLLAFLLILQRIWSYFGCFILT